MTGLRKLAFGAVVVAILAFGVAYLALPKDACACEPPLASPVEGVVIEVEATGLTDVRAFTIRLPAGGNLRLVLGTLEDAAEFPPSHLKEHQAAASAVRAWFNRGANGELVVYRLEDASGD